MTIMEILVIFLTVPMTITAVITIVLLLKEKAKKRLHTSQLDKELLKIPAGFLIFITGTNGVGKTTTAHNLSHKLGLRYTDVSILRETLRSQKPLYDLVREASRLRKPLRSQKLKPLHDLVCEIIPSPSGEDDYKILKLPTYQLDVPDSESDDQDTTVDIVKQSRRFFRQCELVTPAIVQVANYCRKQNYNSVFEGTNVLPKNLIESSDFSFTSSVLFVHLVVSNPKILTDRLKEKAENRAKAVDSFTNKNTKAQILNTAEMIETNITASRAVIKQHNLNEIEILPIDTGKKNEEEVIKEIIEKISEMCSN